MEKDNSWLYNLPGVHSEDNVGPYTKHLYKSTLQYIKDGNFKEFKKSLIEFKPPEEDKVINCGTVAEEKDVKSNPEVEKSFKEKLVEIYEKRKQDLRLTDDYKRIEAQIKQACEKAAYDGRNCVYIMDLRLDNYINYAYHIRDNGRYLEKTIEQICDDLGLDIKGGYITWKNSL